MREPAQSASVDFIVAFLNEVMPVFRDGKPFDPNSPLFGKLEFTDFMDMSRSYTYEKALPLHSKVVVTTLPDPLDDSDDREQVPLVPYSLQIDIADALTGVNTAELRKRLDLADYQEFADGKKDEKTCSISPDISHTTVCTYRANAHADSRFPVNVEFYSWSLNPFAASPTLHLDRIRVQRAYRFLTREMRKKKREEQRQLKREQYGYMNLCTGALCPETGIWEGWTSSGPTDVLRVEKGRRFDVVRTVSLSQGATPCPMIAGQWMWLCSLEEQGDFVWNGFALNS